MSASATGGPEQAFAAALREGRFLIQRCTATGKHVFYPRVLSPHSGEATLEWVEASGRGTVHSTTVVRRKPDQGGDYNVALIDLEEGPRLMSRVEGIAPTEVAIGMPVAAAIIEEEGEPLVVFRPAGTAP
jgi:uncharacterized OB-fold protein